MALNTVHLTSLINIIYKLKNIEGKEDSNYSRTNRPMEQLLQLLPFVVASSAKNTHIYENNYN